MADEYRLDEVFKAKKTAWRAFQRAKERQTIGHGAELHRAIKVAIPACAVGMGHPELVGQIPLCYCRSILQVGKGSTS